MIRNIAKPNVEVYNIVIPVVPGNEEVQKGSISEIGKEPLVWYNRITISNSQISSFFLDTDSFLPKLKIELAVPADRVDQVIDTLSKAAYTGKIGDGKIFVFDLEQVIRVRTGETGTDAL